MEVPRAIEQVGDPGLRDAEGILLRIRQDEAEAVEARIRYRVDGLPSVDVDGLAAERLRPGEAAVDVRSSAVVTRHLLGDGTDEFAGQLVLTTQ